MIEHGPSLLPTAQASKSLPGEYVADGLRGPSSRYQTLPGLLNVLRQRWKVIVYTALAIFALGSIACFLIQSYSATTIIEINKADPTDNDGAQSNGPALSSDDIKDEVATDVSILQTDDSLALTVINKLNLLSEPSFKKAVVDSERNKPLSEAPKTRDRVLKIFRGRLKVETPPDTRLITLTFKASDPVLASNVTNTLADTFIDDTLSRRALAIQRSSNWLQSQLEMLKIRVEHL